MISILSFIFTIQVNQNSNTKPAFLAGLVFVKYNILWK